MPPSPLPVPSTPLPPSLLPSGACFSEADSGMSGIPHAPYRPSDKGCRTVQDCVGGVGGYTGKNVHAPTTRRRHMQYEKQDVLKSGWSEHRLFRVFSLKMCVMAT